MRIETHLRRHAADRPDKTAVVAGETRLTYGLLEMRVNGFSAALAQRGVGRGDRVLFILDTGVDAVISFFAVWRIGAVACPLHVSIKSDKLSAIIANTQPKAIIAEAKAGRCTATDPDAGRHGQRGLALRNPQPTCRTDRCRV
jgi:long-chain acyl-CoA synthetase